MADNYLEKRYAELQQGKPVVRRNTPSLDSLLKKAASHSDQDSGYVVKQAQLDAIVRSVSLLGFPCVFESCETNSSCAAFIRIVSDDIDDFISGEMMLAASLKAAELGLSCRIDKSDKKIEVFR